VSRHYRIGRATLRALEGVDLSIAPGETLGLAGESGSGKSTLGRTLLGLQEPTQGRMRFDGADIAGARGDRLRTLRRRRGLVFQDPSGALNPRMTTRACGSGSCIWAFRRYRRSFESLETFTWTPRHAAWWRGFAHSAGGGIWHETHRLRGGMGGDLLRRS